MMTRKGQRQTNPRISWPPVIARAADIVRAAPLPMSLRQVFYALVSEGLIPNAEYTYTNLSRLTARPRRTGDFPALADGTREVLVPTWWPSPERARADLRRQYREDRTEGQPFTIVVAVEKRGMVPMLSAEFGSGYGLPVVAVGGFASETLEAETMAYCRRYDRPRVLLYAGDHDPSGDIEVRGSIPWTFARNTGPWDAVVRVAVTPEQIAEHQLLENPGKESDSRAAAFRQRYGSLVQVELDALPQQTLLDLFHAALEQFHDPAAMRAVIARETANRDRL